MNDGPRPPASRPDEPTRLPAPSKGEREAAVDRLRAHYVRDDIDVDEYERLLDVAWAADSRSDLDELFSRLPTLPDSERPPARDGEATEHAPALAAPHEQKGRGWQVAIMSGSERKGSWVPPKKLFSLALMGGSGLDFREARLGPGVTEVTILAVMGGVEVIVPPGVTVEAQGLGIMGGFDGYSRTTGRRDPSEPILRVRGLAVMGGIEVKMMLPGETTRDARRRRREERRERRERRRLERDPE
ncbi:MAG: DUF1707 SHOCT-like domain-containing protein [Gemmatimonadota bacterium]